jgi:NAD(P)-dependent dehydrogenase (short-subunit alcohol dehydrogenase family)
MSRRVALVTGARGVVGQALIARLAGVGYHVIAHSRDGMIEVPEGTALLTGDLADPDTALHIRSGLPHVDLLVNNAASQAVGSLDDLSPADWSDMLGSTFLGAVHLTMALRPAMAAGACVVNISSIEAGSAFPGHAHYAAAKAALESFTRSAALEWAPGGIRVNAVAPGLIERPGLVEDWPAGVAWWERTCPLGRMVRADEVADAVLLLAAATGVSGVVLPVDGGWSASARQG